MIDDNVLVKVLEKIKVISVEKFDAIKFLIDTDGKLPDVITLKNVVILIACGIKDGHKFCSQLFLEETLIA